MEGSECPDCILARQGVGKEEKKKKYKEVHEVEEKKEDKEEEKNEGRKEGKGEGPSSEGMLWENSLVMIVSVSTILFHKINGSNI